MGSLIQKNIRMDNLLPPEMTLEILSRLPVESVLKCKLVCKTWLTLLRDPTFGCMHQRRQLLQLDADKYNAAAVKVSFLFLIRYVDLIYEEVYFRDYDENGEEHSVMTYEIRGEEKDNNQLYYREYDENDEDSYKRRKTMNYPPFSEHHNLVSSCNGLICLCWSYKLHEINDPVYICNPLTREYVNLPGLIDTVNGDNNVIRMVCGFGYNPSIDEYKVVRIYYCRNQLFGQVQVYTLGRRNGSSDSPGVWRNKGETAFMLRSSFRCGVLANGALHWLDMEGKIVAFDLAGEDFHMLPSPPCFLPGVKNNYSLEVFEGRLCVVNHKRDKNITDIWLFKKTKDCHSYCKKEAEYYCWSWIWEFTVPVDLFYSLYVPITFTMSGEVLSWYNNYLSRYDPKTGTMENLLNHDDPDLKTFDVISHMNSFLSLKALGEDDVKTVESVGGVTEPESKSS